MIPIRYSSMPYSLLRTEVDRLFDDFLGASAFTGPRTTTRRAGFPAFNVLENDEYYNVEAECPGLTIEDLELSVSGNQLSVSGERKASSSDKAVFHRRERATSKFSRTLSLPTDVDADKVEATLKDGVLAIKLPKAESAKPRKIQVQSH